MNKKIEQLKKEMLDAIEEYEAFKMKNSRKLTKEEKRNRSQDQQLEIHVVPSDVKILELTKENFYELRRLEQNMKNTHSDYLKEYLNSRQK